jgi:hypothetical protein
VEPHCKDTECGKACQAQSLLEANSTGPLGYAVISTAPFSFNSHGKGSSFSNITQAERCVRNVLRGVTTRGVKDYHSRIAKELMKGNGGI